MLFTALKLETFLPKYCISPETVVKDILKKHKIYKNKIRDS